MQTPEQERERTERLRDALSELKSLTLDLGGEDAATGKALLKAHGELDRARGAWDRYRRTH